MYVLDLNVHNSLRYKNTAPPNKDLSLETQLVVIPKGCFYVIISGEMQSDFGGKRYAFRSVSKSVSAETSNFAQKTRK